MGAFRDVVSCELFLCSDLSGIARFTIVPTVPKFPARHSLFEFLVALSLGPF